MQLRLLLQLLLGAQAWAHAIPDGYALPHSLHRRMPPPKLLPPNSHGPIHPGAGKAANHALDPATGAPAEIVDPVTGQLIGDVNPVTGRSQEGFNPLTGQLYDHQAGLMETPPLGSQTLPQNIPKSPASGPPRGGNRKPVPDRAGAWPRHTPSPRPDGQPPAPRPNFQIDWAVHDHGKYLSRLSTSAFVKHRDGLVIGHVHDELSALDIRRDFHVVYGEAPPNYEGWWNRFLVDWAVQRPDNLNQWKRVTVTPKTGNTGPLLDLAVYPERRLVVFMKRPSEQSIQSEVHQRKLSEVIYQSLRGVSPDNSFKPVEFLFPDIAPNSQLGFAASKAVSTDWPGTGSRVLPTLAEQNNPPYLELIGSRSAAPISYIVARHPGNVAGPVNMVTVIKGPHLGDHKAVMITLGPI